MNAAAKLKMITKILEALEDDDDGVETPESTPSPTPEPAPEHAPAKPEPAPEPEPKPTPPPPASVVGQPSPPPSASPGLTEEAIMAMTPAQINENWQAIGEYMAKNGF